MSTTSRVSRRFGSAAAPAIAAVIATAGIAVAAVVMGPPPASRDGHTGDPVTYAGGLATARAPIASDGTSMDGDAAAEQVRNGLSDSQIARLTIKSTPEGLEVAVSLTHNDDRVRDVWLSDLALGAVAELMRSDQSVANDLISRATAVGPGEDGAPVTTYLGIGAVRLGQIFGSPSDSSIAATAAEVANRYGLEVVDLVILHPLESAMKVTLLVPDDALVDWTIDELRADLVGKSPNVEGILIELEDPDGQLLLQSGVAYRTGSGGLWFAAGQDERFGAVHAGTPGH